MKKKTFIHRRERECVVGFSGNRAGNFVDGFIGDGATVRKREREREREKDRESKRKVVEREVTSVGDKVTEWKRRRIMRHRKPNIVSRVGKGVIPQ